MLLKSNRVLDPLQPNTVVTTMMTQDDGHTGNPVLTHTDTTGHACMCADVLRAPHYDLNKKEKLRILYLHSCSSQQLCSAPCSGKRPNQSTF